VNVSVIGSGYIGTTHATCLAELGHDVVAIDIGEDIVAAINDGRAPTLEAESGLRVGEDFHVVINPESLREGSAVDDFHDPDKIVLGGSEYAHDRHRELYTRLRPPIGRSSRRACARPN
jgi:UDP-glucose 6-dehydrogenase